MYMFLYPLHLSSFTPTPFLSFLLCLILLCVSYVRAYPPQHGRLRLLGLYCFLLFPYELGQWLSKSPYLSSPLGFFSCHFSSCYAHGPAGCHSFHVGPLGCLPLFLGFYGLFTLLLPLVVLMGLLAVIPIVLIHRAFYFISWVSTAHLLYFYPSLYLWACWLSFLLCWPIGRFTSLFHPSLLFGLFYY